MKKILIPVDFSEPSVHAVEYGKKMALAFEGKVTLLHVIHDRLLYAEYGGVAMNTRRDEITHISDLMEKDKEEALKQLEAYKEMFKDTGIEVECLVEEGHPADKIIDFVEQNDIRMVVIGSAGIGSALRRVFLGSVANRIVHHVKVPVLLVQ